MFQTGSRFEKRLFMKRAVAFAALLAGLLPMSSPAQNPDDALKSRAELSNYEETSRYADVINFFDKLQQRSPLVRIEIFGHSKEGRALPLVILTDPPISQPREAAASGKPVVFVMANIHAGEVEGKEAMHALSRRIATGDLRLLLKDLVILIAPIYNADGNERINLKNRTDQYGPIGGVGVRENASGLDLNRDYMKMEAPETQALVALFNRWDPLLTVDLHTTDGSYHAYHLTYSPPLNPMADPKLIECERAKMLPSITDAMQAKHHYRTYYYGNFSTKETLDQEVDRFAEPKAGEPEPTRIWRTFDHRPRFGNNYVGLRNRLAILSEAYSHLDFRGRVEATEAFVEEIFNFTAAHGTEMIALTRELDAATVRRGLDGTGRPFSAEFEMRPLPEPVNLLVGDVKKIKNPKSGIDMVAMVEDKVTPMRMPDFGIFVPTRQTIAAAAYLLPAEAGLRVAVEKARMHGIAVEELTAPEEMEVESFSIDTIQHAARPFAGHTATKVTGHYERKTMKFPAGTFLVRAAQPLWPLAQYLIDPESDDGLVAWNFLDAYLAAGKSYPIYAATKPLSASAREMEKP